MEKRFIRLAVLTAVCLSFCMFGCNSKRTSTTTNVEAESLMDAEDFDMDTVVSVIQNGDFDDAEDLQEIINGDNGINNVDLDDDGQIDFVSVSEDELGFFAFTAHLSSMNGDGEEVIAYAQVSRSTTGELTVSGYYPNYVYGYDNYYYNVRMRHGSRFGGWIYGHRPLYSMRAYSTFGYHPRPIYSSSSRSSKRTSYTKTTKIAPVKKSKRPSKLKSSKSANKKKSKFSKGKSKPTGNKLSNRKGKMKDFKKRNTSKKKNKATGFGASSNKKKSSKGWGGSKKKKKSGGWGGGGSKKKKSGGWGGGGSKRKKRR